MLMLMKSFCKSKKKWMQLFLIAFLSTFMLCTLYTYKKARLLIYCGNGMYGSYSAIVDGIEEEDIEKFCNTKDVLRYQKFYRENVIQQERTYRVDYVTEDFLDFTEYELIQGTFPKKSDEILCESWYLYQMGFSQEELIGARITIHEKTYTVSGIIRENRLWTNGIKEAVCICMQNGKINAVAYECENLEDTEEILERNEVSYENISHNINLWAHSDEAYSSFSEYMSVAAIVLVAVILVISNSISLLFLDYRKNIGIYQLVGVPERKIRRAFAGSLIGVVLGGELAGTAGAFLCMEFLFGKLAQLNNLDSVVIEQQFPYLSVILIGILISVLYIIFIYGYCGYQIHKDSFDMVRNERKYKFHKNKRGAKPCTITNIAVTHLRFSRFSNIFTMLAICVIFVAFHIQMFSVKALSEEVTDCKGYDYIADIDSNSGAYINFGNFEAEMERIEEEQRKFMNKMLTLDTNYVKAIPIYCYYTTFNIEKERLSKEYMTGLGEIDSNLRSAVYDNFADDIDVPAVLLGVTEEELEEFYKQQNKAYTPLEDGHCITFSQPYHYTELNKNVVDFSGENKTLELGHTESLQIDNTFSKYTGDLILDSVGEMNNIVIVNLSTYEKITRMYMPSLIYFNVEDSYINEFTKLFEEQVHVRLTDAREEANQLKLQKLYATGYILVAFLLMVFVIVNISSTIYLRAVFFSKEYAIMNAVGVGYHKIASILRRELSCILIPALLIGNVVCYMEIHFIYSQYHKEVYYKSGYPYQLQILSNIGIIFICFLCVQFVIGKLQKLCPHSKLNSDV